MSEETNLAKVNPIVEAIAASELLGKSIAASKMFGCKTIEQGNLIALACIVKRIDPFQFKQTYHVYDDGQICMRADAMLAKFKTNGGKYKILKDNTSICEIEFEWENSSMIGRFTIEQAKAKGLIKHGSAWERWPEDMLFSTVVRKYLRKHIPELFAGHYLPEENYKDVTPIAIPPASKPLLTEKPIESTTIKAVPEIKAAGTADDKPLSEVLTDAGIDLQRAYYFFREINYIRGSDENKVEAINSLNESMTKTVKNHIDELKEKIEQIKEEESTRTEG